MDRNCEAAVSKLTAARRINIGPNASIYVIRISSKVGVLVELNYHRRMRKILGLDMQMVMDEEIVFSLIHA